MTDRQFGALLWTLTGVIVVSVLSLVVALSERCG